MSKEHSTSPPKHLYFVSDQSEAVYTGSFTKPKSGSVLYSYRYTKALENLGKCFDLSLETIQSHKSVKLLITEE